MNILTKKCLNCYNTIYKKPNRSLKDWGNRTKFCSPECRSKYIHSNPLWREKQSKAHTGKKQSVETLEKRSKSQQGEKGSNWQGDKVGYVGIHNWLYKNFGKASHCENPNCFYPRQGAKKWLKKPYRYEWALIKGKSLERKRKNFVQLCIACHRKYDSQVKKSH